MIITLPWPYRGLSPNDRVHWHRKSTVTKMYRSDCYFLAKLAVGASALSFPDAIALEIRFFPADKRKRDRDNMLASFKAGIDGLADALRVSDNRFVPTIRVMPETLNKIEVELINYSENQ